MNGKIKVVGSVVTPNGVTLYCDDGKVVNLDATNHRTHEIINRIAPAIARREVVEVDLNNYRVESQLAAKSGGLLRFFRVARVKALLILGGSASRDLDKRYGGGFVNKEVSNGVLEQTGVADVSEEQIKQLDLAQHEVSTDLTTVAVVNNTPIVGVEAMDEQIKAAARSDEKPVGFIKFMERLATVAKTRKHTAQELLEFMRVADLPIADDGCIIGYKTLSRAKDGRLVDLHSGRVSQTVGSRVEMEVELIDDNRRLLCSNGLHVARRNYLRNYGTDQPIFLVKVAPEDVVSVPLGEPDKMRCAAYHIVAELPTEASLLIRSGKPMTTHERAAVILGNVIKGKHVPVTETVYVGKNSITSTVIAETGSAQPVVEQDETVRADVLDIGPKKRANPIDVGSIATMVSKEVVKVAAKKAPAKKTPANKTTTPTRTVLSDEAKKQACDLVKSGMSIRGAAVASGVSARTISRMLAGSKAA
jgi:RNA-binding protein YhbY